MSARPAFLFLAALADGGFEGLHQGGDLADGRGVEELGAQLGGVFVEFAGHAGDIDEAAAVANEGKEVLRCFEGAVVVALEGLLDDGGV